jgi:flagellar protein FliO/FliZ
MMTQAIISVVAFVLLLAMAPWAVRALKPQQRVVTVEVGPESARTWLVLGVTTQTITNLHSAPAPGFAQAAAAVAAWQPGIVPAVNSGDAKGPIERTHFGGESDARG